MVRESTIGSGIRTSRLVPTARFGLSWFLPVLMQHKTILIQFTIAFFVVFGLLNPLLIQQIIDAVINQGNLSSLNVLGTLLWLWPSHRPF